MILYIVRKLYLYRILFTVKNCNHFFTIQLFVLSLRQMLVQWLGGYFWQEYIYYTEYTYIYGLTEYT